MIVRNVWFVVKSVRKWEWVDYLNTFCWVEESHEQITPERDTEEKANQDFAEFGFALSPTATVQCQDYLKIGELWTRYIVQCKRK
jgi:hypothetical protein